MHGNLFDDLKVHCHQLTIGDSLIYHRDFELESGEVYIVKQIQNQYFWYHVYMFMSSLSKHQGVWGKRQIILSTDSNAMWREHSHVTQIFSKFVPTMRGPSMYFPVHFVTLSLIYLLFQFPVNVAKLLTTAYQSMQIIIPAYVSYIVNTGSVYSSQVYSERSFTYCPSGPP